MAQTNLQTGTASNRNHARHRARRALPYLGALVLTAVLVAGLRPQPLPVETARATVGMLRATVNEEGKTRVRQRYVVAAPVTGQLRRLPFKEGAEVEAGKTVVAVIEPMPPAPLDARNRAYAEARLGTTSANLDKARAAHDYAVRELRRAEKLRADNTISEQELDAYRWRETDAAKAVVAAESARREIEAALLDFALGGATAGAGQTPVEVKAPASGRVLRVLQESAKVVTPGTALMEIGDPADLEVVIEVLSRDGAAIAPGTKVEFEQWGGAAPLPGRVRLVEPAAFTKVSALGVEEQRVNVIADLLAPPEQRRTLGDQYRVEAKIIVWETSQTLKVPSGALFRRGQQWAVFTIVAGRAQLRSVKTGRSSGTDTQILEGLQAGDEVIVYPGDRVREGVAVRAVTF